MINVMNYEIDGWLSMIDDYNCDGKTYQCIAIIYSINTSLPFSTMNDVNPSRDLLQVLAYIRNTSPVSLPSIVPLVIHILDPFKVK